MVLGHPYEGTQLLPMDMQLALKPLATPYARRCPWQHAGVVDMASQAAEPRSTSWAITAPPVPRGEKAWVRVAREALAAEGRVNGLSLNRSWQGPLRREVHQR